MAAPARWLARGGKRQRLARALREHVAAAAPAASSQGPLDGDDEVEALVELFALGIISSRTVQELASAAQRMAPRPQMATLAGLGVSGAIQRNIHRDLVRKLRLGSLQIAEPMLIPLPMMSQNAVGRHRPGRVEQQYPVPLPHELLASIYTHHRAEFDRSILVESHWKTIGPTCLATTTSSGGIQCAGSLTTLPAVSP